MVCSSVGNTVEKSDLARLGGQVAKLGGGSQRGAEAK